MGTSGEMSLLVVVASTNFDFCNSEFWFKMTFIVVVPARYYSCDFEFRFESLFAHVGLAVCYFFDFEIELRRGDFEGSVSIVLINVGSLHVPKQRLRGLQFEARR